MPGPAPPPGSKELRPFFGSEVLEICAESCSVDDGDSEPSIYTLRVSTITEVILFAVRIAENVVSQRIHEEDARGVDRTKFYWVEREVPSLKGVYERHPEQITDWVSLA
jgi:hypothetical protein